MEITNCYDCKSRKEILESFDRKFNRYCLYENKKGYCLRYNFSCDIDIQRFYMIDNALIEWANK